MFKKNYLLFICLSKDFGLISIFSSKNLIFLLRFSTKVIWEAEEGKDNQRIIYLYDRKKRIVLNRKCNPLKLENT